MSKFWRLGGAFALLFVFIALGHAQSSIMLWNSGPNLQFPRDSGSAVTVGNAIYFFGGNTTVPTSVEALAPGATVWTTASPLQVPRIGTCAAVAGFIGVIGGKDGRRAIRDLTGYNPAGQSSNVKSMNTARYQHACVSTGLGYYAIGGKDAGEAPLSSGEVFGGNRWGAIAPLPEARFNFSAASDGLGNVMTFGGSTLASAATNTVYKLAGNAWTTAAPMPIATSGSAVVAGAYRLIYVIGGNDGTGPINAVQVYHIDTDTWTVGTSLPVAVSNASAVIDSAGNILVIGGVTAGNINTSATWTSTQEAAPPVFSSFPVTTVLAGSLYNYLPTSIGNPAATYSLIAGPAGMTMDPTNGVVSWTPALSQVGVFDVTVRASNLAGSVDQSFTVSVSPPAPTGLAASNITANSVTLTWNPLPAEAGTATYSVFERFCGGRSGCRYSPISTTGSATTLTINALISGSSHDYAVGAVANSAASPLSAPVFIATLQVAAPTNLIATGATQNSVTLAWTPPATTALPVAGYRVFEYVAAVGLVARIDNTPSTSATMTGLLANSNHLFYVCSLDADGNQSFILGPLSVTTNSIPVVFHNPAFLRPVGGGFYNETLAGAIGDRLMLVSSEAHSTSPVDYVIGGLGTPAPTFSLVTAPDGMTIDPVTGVVRWVPGGPTGTFTATARGTNVEGSADFTFSYTVYPAGTDLLSPTTVLMFQAVVSNITRTSATITWNPVTDNVGVAGYRVYAVSPILVCGTSTGCPPLPTMPPIAVVNGTTTTVNLSGLTRNTGYSYWIEAFDAAGNTSYITQGVQRSFTTLN